MRSFRVDKRKVHIISVICPICHAPGQMGALRAALAGCHSSGLSRSRAVRRLSPSPWEAVRKYHCRPTVSWRPECESGSGTNVDRWVSASPSRRRVRSLGCGVCARSAVYSVFKMQMRGRKCPLTIRGFWAVFICLKSVEKAEVEKFFSRPMQWIQRFDLE